MAKKPGKGEILASFFDDGAYKVLFAGGAVTAAYGNANGQPVYAVVQDGSALSAADLQKNGKILDFAAATGTPVVTVYDSAGAKLEEGAALLTAYAHLNEKIARLSGVVPQIAVVIGVCAASAALSATCADICIVTEDADFFFTAPFTSAAAGDWVRHAGSCEFATDAGVAARVEPDALAAVATAARLVGLLPSNNLTAPSAFEYEPSIVSFDVTKWDPAKAIDAILDRQSGIPLYAGYAKGVSVALGTLNGNPVGVVATGDKICRLCAGKTARFVRLCDAFSIPVVTLINTEGFAPSCSDDRAGGIREAARLSATYADATTARIAVLAGRAIGPVYLSLANADLRIAVEGCTVGVVDPKTAVSVLEKDELDQAEVLQTAIDAHAAAYAAKHCIAQAAVDSGLADLVSTPDGVRASVGFALDMLATKRAARLAKKHGNMPL